MFITACSTVQKWVLAIGNIVLDMCFSVADTTTVALIIRFNTDSTHGREGMSRGRHEARPSHGRLDSHPELVMRWREYAPVYWPYVRAQQAQLEEQYNAQGQQGQGQGMSGVQQDFMGGGRAQPQQGQQQQRRQGGPLDGSTPLRPGSRIVGF